jgi:hypothetical protein
VPDRATASTLGVSDRATIPRVNLEEGTRAAISMIRVDLARLGLVGALDAASPDGDIGKFSLFGQAVRVITHRDGYYLNVNLAWFNGADAPAQISGGPIEVYCFVLKGPVTRYWLCDWRMMRKFVLDFTASSLPHYKQTVRWRSDVQAIQHAPDAALFRWGDENGMEQLQKPSRIVDLGNAVSVQPVRPEAVERHDRDAIGRALGGEGQAHKLLKLYLSKHPELVGASPNAEPCVEYQFRTGDRVDLMFKNHFPERTVVEIEVEGRENLIVGVHQAVKYAALAAMERDFPVVTHRVRPHVVAYKVDYPSVIEVADRYGVNLVAVDPGLCLVA